MCLIVVAYQRWKVTRVLERGSKWSQKHRKMENLAVGLDGRTEMLDCRKDSGDLGCRTRSVNPALLFGALAARSAHGVEKGEKLYAQMK